MAPTFITGPLDKMLTQVEDAHRHAGAVPAAATGRATAPHPEAGRCRGGRLAPLHQPPRTARKQRDHDEGQENGETLAVGRRCRVLGSFSHVDISFRKRLAS